MLLLQSLLDSINGVESIELYTNTLWPSPLVARLMRLLIAGVKGGSACSFVLCQHQSALWSAFSGLFVGAASPPSAGFGLASLVSLAAAAAAAAASCVNPTRNGGEVD